MIPKWHIIFGAVFSIIIYFIFNITLIETLLIFFSSFLIDFDHYLWFIFAKKDINIFKSIRYLIKKRKIWINLKPTERIKYKRAPIIFHGIEFIALIILLMVFFPILLFVLIGVIFHLLLDYIEMTYYKEPIINKISQTALLINNIGKRQFY